MPSFRPSIFAAISVLLGSAVSIGAEPKTAFSREELDFFEKKIRPVLAEHCYKCHSKDGEKGVKSGLALDSRQAIVRGGDGGPAIEMGQPDKSLIIQAIRYSNEDLQMPPKHRLSAEQIKDFEEWVRMGAPAPEGPALAATGIDFAKAKDFWSLRPASAPTVPEVRDTSWPRGEIDRFLLAKMEAAGVKPNADADKRTLLRRVTFDLTGLPPTVEEMREFMADNAPDSFAKVVERLLASSAYGERWGRHWLDVVRYADTAGCNSDFPVPSAYRYRNWVINAFNRDLPYDEFLRKQIAGDLQPAANDEERYQNIVATGYLATARRFGSRANEFHLTVEDLIDNLGKTTMGLSLGCARCHDHKFDPVSNRDYYALYGIFSSSKFAFPGTEIYRHTKDFTPLVPEPEASKFLAEGRELSALDDKIENLRNEKKRLERQEKKAEEEAKKQAAASQPMPVANVESKPVEPVRTSRDVRLEIEKAEDRIDELEERADAVPKAYAVMEGEGKNARIQRKGEPDKLGDEVPRGFLTVLGGQTLPGDEKGSGRRQLAQWLTDPGNPLTARVMVNRIWEHHFGRGIVKTPNDFGVRGEKPTHPELLDWLAKRFVDGGWSMKAMHRAIVLSRAYQVSSDANEASATKDATNDLVWRFNRRRMSAEELRDSVLSAAGTLDRTPGGQHPFPREAKWRYTQHRPFIDNYETSTRSIYLMQQRIRKQPFLELFDGADPNATTAVRPISHTPVQALWAMNSSVAHEQARKLAERCQKAFSDPQAQIAHAFELVLSRTPSAEEVTEVQQHIAAADVQLEEANVPVEERAVAAFASFTRVLLTSNEFVFID